MNMGDHVTRGFIRGMEAGARRQYPELRRFSLSEVLALLVLRLDYQMGRRRG